MYEKELQWELFLHNYESCAPLAKLVKVCKKLKKLIQEHAKYSRCLNCGKKKACKCWRKINYSNFLQVGICEEEIDLFGPLAITAWSNAKFLGRSKMQLSGFEKLCYHFTLLILLRLPTLHNNVIKTTSDLILMRIRTSMINSTVIDPKAMLLPLILYSKINPFIKPSVFSSSVKDIPKGLRSSLKLKNVLKKYCIYLENNKAICKEKIFLLNNDF